MEQQMPVTILVEFPDDGFLNQFMEIGGRGILSPELKGKEQQRKENKKSVYHMPGGEIKRGSGLRKAGA